MSWNDLYQMSAGMTEAEIRFEKAKRLTGLFLGPLLFVMFGWFWPPLPHVNAQGMIALGIVALAITWWMTEALPVPVTSLMMLPLSVICGLFPYQRAFGYWADWTNLFLIGAFIIGGAMEVHGLTRRVSLALVASDLVRGNAWRLLVFFLIANIFTTAFTSNTVTAILYLSVGMGLLKTLEISPGSTLGSAMFLGIAWATNIGGKLTPSGSVPNMVAIGLAENAGQHIGYVQWVLANVAFTTLQTIAMLVILRLFLSKQDREMKINSEAVKAELAKLGPFTRGEWAATIALIVALLCWTMPDIVPLVLGSKHPLSVWLSSHLNWGVSALLVAGALFVTPLDWEKRRFAMTWDTAVEKIEWGVLALVAGSLVVGGLIADKQVGLGQLLSTGMESLVGAHPPKFLLLLGIAFTTTLLAQVTSAVAIVSATGPIALAVAPSLGLHPLALLVMLSLTANMGYTLPSSTPPNAIVFASGYLRISYMVVRGSVLAIVGIILLSMTGYNMAEFVFTHVTAQ